MTKTPTHPLTEIALKALAFAAQDALTLGAYLAGQNPPDTPALTQAYKSVAQDVLSNLEARGLASCDAAGWYQLCDAVRR